MFRKPLVLIFLACAACGSSPTPVDTHAKAEPKASAVATAAPPPVNDGSSDETAPAEGDEPKVSAKTFAELQKAALACPMNEEGTIEVSCEGYEAWTAEQPALEEGRANAQLLEMLVSKDVKARILAAERLRMAFNEENLDAANAEKLLAAVESEREEAAIKPMLAMVTGQNLVKAGKIDRAIAIGKASPKEDFRETMLIDIGFYNRDKAVLAWARDASKDKNSRIRNAALRAAGYHTVILPDEACKLIDGFRADKDEFVKDSARTILAESSKCSSFFGKLLDDLGSVPLKKDVPGKLGIHFSYGQALTGLCRHKDLEPKWRERALKAAKRLADSPEVSSNIRHYATEAVTLCEAKGAKK